jgi:DNA-binding transcriptional ArsR family regulator
MRDLDSIVSIGRALSDETRVRLLLALSEGELCLCHLVDLVEMAPSTVSKHMQLLYQAGLVERRKDGRWVHFRLAGKDAPPAAASALRWVRRLAESDEALRRARDSISTQICDICPQ